MTTFRQDARYSLRQLLRQRAFTLVAVLTLALGIGASTAIFTVIDAAMLRPLPYADPEQLVTVGVEIDRPDSEQPSRPTPSRADMELWRQQRDVFSFVAATNNVIFGRIIEGPEPERLQTSEITPDYLPMHGVTPVIGRGLGEADMAMGAPDVVLLGYGYWQRRHGGDRDVLGEVVRAADGVATIVGVLPQAFEPDTPLWRPLRTPPDEMDGRGTGRVSAYARLQPGVTIEDAARRLSERMPPFEAPNGEALAVNARVTSRLESATSRYRTTVNVIAGAVAMILLIACVNVAGLLLARGATRQAELAVRASLGATRWRLVRQLLTESVVLAMAGGLLGIGVAYLSLDALVANLPLSLPSNSPAALNAPVLAAALLLTLATGLLFGLAPAFRLSRVRLNEALAHGNRRHGSSLSRRGSQALVAAEVALAVVLVVGAGLMIRSFSRVSAVDIGFDPDEVVTMEVQPVSGEGAAQAQFYPQVLRAIRAIPGIEAAGAVDHFPLAGSSSFTSASAEGRSIGVGMRQTMPGYFEALGLAPVEGRLPTDADEAAGRAVALLNKAAARELFPDGPAVGRQVEVSRRPMEIIGVVPTLRHGGPLARAGRESEAFVPFQPREGAIRALGLTVVVRPRGDVPDLAARLRQAAQSVGPPVLIERVRGGSDWFGERVVTPRRRTVLLGLLGGLGLVLALVGIFGMTAYAVARRTQEIGVRMAFGARPGQVVRSMVRDAAVPIAIGTLLGLAGASLATRVIESFLFDTAPTDPATFAVAAVALAASGLLAAWLPARRAARVDPVATLRAE